MVNSHECTAPGCTTRIPSGEVFCGLHAQQLPRPLLRRIIHLGQAMLFSAKAGAEYREAVTEALDHLRERT